MVRARLLRRKWLAFRALDARAQDADVPQRPVVQLALTLCVVGGVVLCGLNDKPFRFSGQLRGVAQAAFCIAAAGLYLLFMIAYQLVAWVRGCAEDRWYATARYDATRYQECVQLCDPSSTTAEHSRHAHDGDAEEAPAVGVPREVVISSMYLGGTGMFLAVAPLCMWYYTTSLYSSVPQKRRPTRTRSDARCMYAGTAP